MQASDIERNLEAKQELVLSLILLLYNKTKAHSKRKSSAARKGNIKLCDKPFKLNILSVVNDTVYNTLYICVIHDGMKQILYGCSV